VTMGHFGGGEDCVVGLLCFFSLRTKEMGKLLVDTLSISGWGVGSSLYGSSAHGAALGLVVMIKTK